ELLDETENVVPAPAILADDVGSKLIQDLVDLERGENGLDQHGDLDLVLRHDPLLFREAKNVVPDPGFQVRFELGQVKVRAGAALFQLRGVVKEVQAEIDQCARYRLAVDHDVLFRQMP